VTRRLNCSSHWAVVAHEAVAVHGGVLDAVKEPATTTSQGLC